jgi:hypothetical protein
VNQRSAVDYSIVFPVYLNEGKIAIPTLWRLLKTPYHAPRLRHAHHARTLTMDPTWDAVRAAPRVPEALPENDRIENPEYNGWP